MPPFTADAHAELSLDFSVVQAQLAKGYEKPFLILDTSIVREKARRFFAANRASHLGMMGDHSPEWIGE